MTTAVTVTTSPTATNPPGVAGFPTALAVMIGELLQKRHAAHVFPALMSLLGPHVGAAPLPSEHQDTARVDIQLVRRMVLALSRADALGELDAVLSAATPWLGAGPVASSGPTSSDATEAAGLSGRELQVLVGMSEGKSNCEIGRDLFLSEDTVKSHARRLFPKLGARDRAHAVALAYRAGILQGQPNVR